MQPQPAGPPFAHELPRRVEPVVAPAAEVLKIGYHGTGGGLFVLTLKNLLLTLVTLGIYLPWARTERRKYLWQNIDVGGHRLRYHGTGGELLVGYLKVMAVYVLLFGIPFGIGQVDKTAGLVAQGAGGLFLVLLIPLAIYGAQKYRLSRTSLRGVRFGLDAGAGAYWRKFVLGYLLVIVTLGFWRPILQNRLQAFLTKRTRYGSEAFDYDGKDAQAFRIHMTGVLFSIVTLGFFFPWWTAAQARFRLSSTGFQGARGCIDLTGGDVFKILFVSIFGTVLTVGIAFPWITTWALRTITSKMSFVGTIDFGRIERRATDGSAAADGFADALDVGLQI